MHQHDNIPSVRLPSNRIEFSLDHIPLFPILLRLLFFSFPPFIQRRCSPCIIGFVLVVVVVGVVRVLSPLNDHRVFIRGKRRVL